MNRLFVPITILAIAGIMVVTGLIVMLRSVHPMAVMIYTVGLLGAAYMLMNVLEELSSH